MTTIELSPQAHARLLAEAARRGISLDQLITEFAAQVSVETDPLEAFIASGSSGHGRLGRHHREILAEQTAGRSAVDL